ncbi:MAG TPA: FG-GAP-like repeat-containing protein, partial [Acidobacteriota bacterium]
MRSTLVAYLGGGLAAAALGSALLAPAAQAQGSFQACEPMPADFTESFNDTSYRDPAKSSVDGWGTGLIQLNPKGGDFSLPPAGDFPSWINTATANDFDGDGWPDFVATSSEYSQLNQRVVVLVRNQGYNFAHFQSGGGFDTDYGPSNNFGVGHFDIYADRGGDPSGQTKDYMQIWADAACIDGADGDAIDSSGLPYNCTGGSHVTLVSGDFDKLGNLDVNGDGVIKNGRSDSGYDPANFDPNDYKPSNDFIYLISAGGSDEAGTGLHTAIMFLNQQTVAERDSVLDNDFSNDLQPTFAPVDLMTSSRLKDYDKLKGIGWSATTADAVDLDQDGDLDVVMGNNKGEVWFWQSDRTGKLASNFKFAASKLFSTNYSFRGVSVLKAADLDGDGDLDLVAGSVSGANLQIWLNDGNEKFTKRNVSFVDTSKTFSVNRPVASTVHPSCLSQQLTTINAFRGAATVLILEDFDEDGDPDIFVSGDNWNYQSGG